uniref:VTT domain-containing protein n=1 Tax=Chromera velia CCMP2878 TaxID=1169474 RepID=A0A0G4FAP5_9ALVE|mmetsp:Transcript_20900/g.41670  ORF Transcript_20900/g.41670 Transcript_20900/m.41670 type:complete len:404 (+) Transcript_20900:132-1343(+)|eukprot:Cvel_3039.t1-p1 / transcript=Cvel_3039.t1 / gene=Cvel_3039 / organism=Chromera_velia_CCMP2878 / gene_product=hypothetical protein / transcript_product=hypothetical protein / location=Cvel_scaffold121:90973-93976(+) / protein_length=403 / sequence_SO=supercontig / SO=protein_coding / is_pseudo=false
MGDGGAVTIGVKLEDRPLSASTLDCKEEPITEDTPSDPPSLAGAETTMSEEEEPKGEERRGCLKRVPWKALTPIFLAMALVGILAATVFAIGPVRIAAWIEAALGVESGKPPSAQGFLVAFLVIAVAFPACLPTGMFEVIISFFMGWWVLIPAFAGRLAGAIAAFYLGRSCCRRRAGKLLSEFRRLRMFSIVVKEAPYRYLLMLQFTFLPRAVKTYGAAAFDVTCLPFVTSIMIASIPGTIMSVATGSTAGDVTAFLTGQEAPSIPQILLLCAGVVFMIVFAVCIQRAVGRKLKALEKELEEAEKREKMEEGEGVSEPKRQETMRDLATDVGEIEAVNEDEEQGNRDEVEPLSLSEDIEVVADLGEEEQPATNLPLVNSGRSGGSFGCLSPSPVPYPAADVPM